MPDVDERILERVRKLLTRAEHPTTPAAEAEACSEKAAALMSRYVIDQALLDERSPRSVAPMSRKLLVDPPYAVAKAVLLDCVAKAFRVPMAIGRQAGTGGRVCTMVGFPADLDSVELLFTSLLLQAATAMLAAGRGRSDLKAFRRAFLIGYAETIGARLARANSDARREATETAPGTAVVLADRSAQVDAAFAAEFPRLRSMRTTVSSGGGLFAGRDAGARANLSATRTRIQNDRGQLAG